MNESLRPWSENTAPSFLDTLISMREEAVKEQLAIYIQNLNRLEIQKAQRGLDVPTHLLNEIDYTYKEIVRLMRELWREEGILGWLDGPRDAYALARLTTS